MADERQQSQVAPAGERTAAGPGGGGPAPGASVSPPSRKGELRTRLAIGLSVLLLAGFLYWLHARKYEETDDAQIDANISSISSRVPGTVKAVEVAENQEVRAGDVLVSLDPTDLEVALAQAKAAVAQAEAQVAAESPSVSMTQTTNRTQVDSARGEVASAQAEVEASQRDLEQAQANAHLALLQLDRARKLVASNTISQSDFDQRKAQSDVAAAAVAAAQKRLEEKRSHLATAASRLGETRQNGPRQLVTREAELRVRQANLELAQAQLRQAQLNLGYADLVAPASGIIGHKSITAGDRVQPGQTLMALTQLGDLWVTANFRETQLSRMERGQPVSLHVDAIDKDFEGTVESFAGATGSRYSLLPPENASGNYVKVVQRVPVRIRFVPGQTGLEKLRPGLSVEASVKVR